MKKVNPLSKLFVIKGIVLSGILLASCNFFDDGSDFKEQLAKDIAYANAKSLEIIVSPDEGTGSTIPSGKQTVKQGYPIEVSFTEANGWSFVKWIAVSKTDSSKIFESGVDFDDATSLRTNATVRLDSSDVRIVPLCTDRISVSGEPNPKYDANGVSRDRFITVEFSKEPGAESFVFSMDELPKDASPVTNEKGEIWAYTLNEQRFFKNISITNADGYSLAAHFKQPAVEGKLLTVEADKTNPILFGTGETLKTVIVTLSDGICDGDGVTMTAEKSWRYQITEATDEKATINFVSVPTEGTLSAVSKAYSIGQKISLGFSESADYQFVRWDYDKNYIYIEDNRKADTTITVLEKTSESEPTQVKAVCAPRLRVASFSPVTGTAKSSVSKNTSISIEFSQALPDDEEGLLQLENILIAVGGSPVKSSFLSPSVIGSTVTFTADKTNMLDVPSGQTKTVTVSVPADFYYQLDDGTKVTFGGNGKTFDYKIDETTNEKAVISFIAKNSGSGRFTKASGTDNSYSLGERIDLAFALEQGWQFNGWKVLDESGKELGADAGTIAAITVEEPFALATKLCVNEEVQGIRVVADTSRKLAVSKVTPDEDTNPKDSDIELTFNTALAPECAQMLSDIKITLDGANVDSSYTARNLSSDGSKIVLKNNRRLTVADGMTKTVKVVVPSTFFYKDGDVTLNLESGYTYSFVVDSTSNARAEVTFSSKTGTVTPAFGTTYKYSLDTEIPLGFTPNSGYQFNGWSVTDKDGNEIPESQIKIADRASANTKIFIYEPVSGATVTASASEKLSVTATTPNAETNPKDSSITITFNKELASDCDLSKIKVTMGDDDVGSYFADEKRTLSGNKITIKNTKILGVTGSDTKAVTVTIPSSFYYKDGETSVQLSEGYSFKYVVNSTTNDKSSVSFENSTAGTMNHGATEQFSIGASTALKFTIADGYQFNGWTVTDSEGKAVSEDIIKIDDTTAVSTNLTVNQAVQDITVRANVSEKLTVTATSPNATTNPKDSSITITFNKDISSDCDLSKIKITMDGTNVDSYFTDRTLEGKKITLKNTKFLNVAGSDTKTISVTVPKTFFYKDGDVTVNLEDDYSFDYQISSTTTEKARVSFETSKTGAGTINQGTTASYNIGESVAIKFNISDGYQFNGWTLTDASGNEVSESEIVIADKAALNTTLSVLDSLSADVIVRANVSEKLTVTATSPNASTNPKDSSITISFNNELSSDCDLSKIKITMDGANVDSYFATRTLSGTKITLTNTKFLNVTGSETKTISVTIPKTFFYKDGDVIVSLADDYSFVYEISSTTTEQAKVSFETSKTGAGTINQGTKASYNIGETVALKFNLAAGYQFNGWSVTDTEGKSVSEDILKIENTTATSTTLSVYQSVQGVTVKANVSEKLTVMATSPIDKTNPKDSPITITFNKELSKDCDLSKIKITLDGANVESCFATRTLKGNKIIINNTKFLNVTGNETKMISVTIPKTFFYKDENVTVNLAEDYYFEYEVSSTTTKQTSVTYNVATENSGTINQNATASYNIGESVELKFNVADGYQFTGWKMTDSDGNAISEDKIKIENENALSTKMQIFTYISDVKITANALRLPAIISYTPSNTETAFSSEPIRITFSMPMEKLETTVNESKFNYSNIFVTINGTSVADKFESPVFNDDKTVLTLQPKIALLKQYILDLNAIVADVYVSFGSIYMEKDGYSLPLKKDSNSNIRVTYKADVEKVSPTKVDFFASRQLTDLEDTVLNKMKIETIENIPSLEIYKNLTDGTVYIYGKYYDKDSGVKTVTITEEYTNNIEGESVLNTSSYYKTEEKDFTAENAAVNNSKFTSDGKGNTTFCIEYKLKGTKQNPKTGAVSLNVKIKDACGNYTEENFSVINCAGLEKLKKQIDCKIFNDFTVAKKSGNTTYYTFDNYETDIKTIRIEEKDGKQLKIYGSAPLPFQDTTYYCEYTDKNGQKRKELFSEYDSATNERNLLLELDEVALVNFKVSAYYDGIYIASEELSFPKNVLLRKQEFYDSGRYWYKWATTHTTYKSFRATDYGAKDCPTTDVRTESISYYGTQGDYTYYLVNYNDSDGNKIFGEVYGPFVAKEVKLQSLAEPTVESWELKRSSTEGYADLVIKTSSGWWNTYDNLSLELRRRYTGGGTTPTSVQTVRTVYYEKYSTQAALKIHLSLMYNDNESYYYYMYLVGEKEGCSRAEICKTLYVPKSDRSWNHPDYDIRLTTDEQKRQFDNDKPYLCGLIYDAAHCNFLKIGFCDNSTGPSNEGNVICNQIYTFGTTKGATLEGTKAQYAEVPMWALHLGENSFVCNMKDKAGYTASAQGTFTVGNRFKLLDNSPVKGSAFRKPELSQECLSALYRGSTWTPTNGQNSFTVFKFNSGAWSKTFGFNKYDMYGKIGGDYKHYTLNTTIDDFPENSFIRLLYTNTKGCIFYEYYYTGVYSGNGDYNIMMPNGNSKSSIVISSDAPVLVTSLAKKDSYEICKDMSAEDWLCYGRPIKEEILNFSTAEHNVRRYNIPTEKLESDDTCYCVVAVFQDNTILMSDVMQK